MVRLTPRELQVLKLIVDNEFSSSEVAAKLKITVGTVDTPRKNLHKKTFTKNSVGLTKFAIKNSLVKLI
jgi:DNA-binding CsgD family transcriptional regulator